MEAAWGESENQKAKSQVEVTEPWNASARGAPDTSAGVWAEVKIRR